MRAKYSLNGLGKPSINAVLSLITVAIASVFGPGCPFSPGGLNNLLIMKHVRVAVSSGLPVVVTAVEISHYLKLRNCISVQVMCL